MPLQLLGLLAEPLVKAGMEIIDRVVPDKNAAAKAKQELAARAQSNEFQVQLQQILVNLEEAKNPSIFVAGWRPFVGWTCGFAFAYNYIVLPFMQFFIYAFGTAAMVTQIGKLPLIDFSVMAPVLLGMLGLTAARTREKEKGVARDQWSVKAKEKLVGSSSTADSPFPSDQ